MHFALNRCCRKAGKTRWGGGQHIAGFVTGVGTTRGTLAARQQSAEPHGGARRANSSAHNMPRMKTHICFIVARWAARNPMFSHTDWAAAGLRNTGTQTIRVWPYLWTRSSV